MNDILKYFYSANASFTLFDIITKKRFENIPLAKIQSYLNKLVIEKLIEYETADNGEACYWLSRKGKRYCKKYIFTKQLSFTLGS